MQTDPNWSNFLYNHPERVLNLIDFGAAQEYNKVIYMKIMFALYIAESQYSLLAEFH